MRENVFRRLPASLGGVLRQLPAGRGASRLGWGCTFIMRRTGCVSSSAGMAGSMPVHSLAEATVSTSSIGRLDFFQCSLICLTSRISMRISAPRMRVGIC